MIRLVAALALAALASGCGEQRSSADQPATKSFELAEYPFEREGYYGIGSSIREIDPDRLEPLTRRGLRLGGYANQFVVSPDRTEAAFGVDFGELVLVDLAKLTLRDRLRLGKPDLVVRPVGWPRPDLLFTLGCTDMGKHGCYYNRLLLIDPTVPRQVASFDLGGGAEGRYDPLTPTSAIFVAPRRIEPARLLIAESTGAIHTVELTRILVGDAKRRFGPHYRSADFVLERGRAIVLGSRGLIAEVSLRSRRVRYHRVPELSVSRVSVRRAPSERCCGTMNPFSDETILADRAWPGTFLVTSARSRLVNPGSVRSSTRTWLLDTRTWNTTRWAAGHAQRGADLLIVSRTAKPYRGPTTILAYERSGAVRYRLRFPELVTYSTYRDRLYVGGSDGRKTRIFDARTGRLLHRVPPTDVDPAFSWTPPE